MQNYQNDSPINNTDSLFDFVFIDADKENLLDYFDLIISMVKIGGIITTIYIYIYCIQKTITRR
jgi:caffeoyl-CoA O-methyltransferase